MDNYIPEKTELKGIDGFMTLKNLENVEETDDRLHNIQSARFF